MNLKPGLYVVSTPIGNLDDITLRALSVLKHSEIILCEDTRVSGKLLAKHGIKAPLTVYNDKSDEKIREKIRLNIDQGKVISLISDAGTPLISDPGYKLVRDLKKLGYPVDVIPGACSPIAALTISGLPTDRFLFIGFLPKTSQGRKNIFEEFAQTDSTLICFDTAGRLLSSLEAALSVLGNREACVARELTKMFQESKTANIAELIDYYKSHTLKGEIVLLIAKEELSGISGQELHAEIKAMLDSSLSAKSVTDSLYEKYKNTFTKKEIYKMVNDNKTK
jgi:16S rRNA (cytidine1402-2'-O)-methyltransferase